MVYLTLRLMPKADLSHYQGREQAYVKHYLLEKYLPDWAYKVGTRWDSLVYIDGFAGPWGTTDPNYADSSFALAVDTLRTCRLGLQKRGLALSTHAILVESDKDAFAKLDSFAHSANGPDVSVTALPGKFVDTIPKINEQLRLAGPRAFKFVLLDPMGWADIPMKKLQPFLKMRSCEVLINLMTKHINRFLNEEDRASSYNNLFGRPGVLESLRSAVGEEREELAVKEYCRSLQMLCGFKFVSSAVILEPQEAKIRYFLVYATNHPRGIEVFKAAENKAANMQEIVRQEKLVQKTGQTGFDFADDRLLSSYTFRLYRRYCDRAREKVIECLKKAPRAKIPYWKLFFEAMAFPLVAPDDLLVWLDEFDPYIELHPAEGHKKLSPTRADDHVTIIDRHRLQ
ncbi:MAG TPA: three-Cys-motif partner protein TcmP [Pyrinomonadaceae bacterium]